jgi:hypothetical protein
MEWRNTSLAFPSASSWSEHSGGGGMEATSPGGAVVGRGGRPSPEILRGSGVPLCESISFPAVDSVTRTPAKLRL